MWFKDLTGFDEESPGQVRENLVLDGSSMVSKKNQREMHWGRLEIPTLAELRSRVRATPSRAGTLRLREVMADVQELHKDPAHAGALFQVASQSNLLEMVSPGVVPEHGVDIYEDDMTQGPACAIACGAATIYRNYFVPVNGNIGQTTDNQIDCLSGIGEVLGNSAGCLWEMRNGYALASEEGLQDISVKLSAMDEGARDDLRQRLRIGLQWDTEVTLANTSHRVTQSMCSALPVAYARHPDHFWSPFACLVLEATYEATLCAAVLNQAEYGCNKVFLTLVGGGAFGNPEEWILSAIRRAADIFRDVDLDLAIVSRGWSKPSIQRLASEYL